MKSIIVHLICASLFIGVVAVLFKIYFANREDALHLQHASAGDSGSPGRLSDLRHEANAGAQGDGIG